MRILRTYILKEFLLIFIFSFLVINIFFLGGNLYQISDMIIRKGVPLLSALRLFYFIAPRIAEYTMPLAFLFAVLLTMGRLIADNELVAIQASGISIMKIFSLFLLISLIFSLSLLYLKSKVFPDIHFAYRTQLRSMYSQNIPALIEPGVFLDDFQNYVLYVGNKRNHNLENVYIYKTDQEENITEITFAKTGRFVVDNNLLKIKLGQGFRDITSPASEGGPYRLNFDRYFMNLPIQEEEVKVTRTYQNMHLEQLQKEISVFRQKGAGIKARVPARFLAEFHRRISFSFAPLAFVILGFGVSMTVKHREKSINFIIAAFTAGIYYLLFLLGETLTEYHLLAPALAMWLPNIVIALIGIFLFYKYAYFR